MNFVLEFVLFWPGNVLKMVILSWKLIFPTFSDDFQDLIVNSHIVVEFYLEEILHLNDYNHIQYVMEYGMNEQFCELFM